MRAYCIPASGLHKAANVYAVCVGVLNPRVLVDPAIYGKPGEQALVAHEFCHAEQRHALKVYISLFVGTLLSTLCLAVLAYGGPFCLPWAWNQIILVLGPVLWWANHLVFLRDCEIEADRAALDRTDPKTFVAFLYLHPHQKGRWWRWKYGSSQEARARRVLPDLPEGRAT